MATPHSARPGARPLPWLAFGAVLVAGAAALHGVTNGLTAWTLDQRRDVRVARQQLYLPAIDVRNQLGQPLRLFAVPRDPPAGAVTPDILIVDFLYTRCPTVCRALGAEFTQLAGRIDDDGMAGRIGLVSLSFDPRDTVGDLRDYANTYRARTPVWQVAAAQSADAMAALLRQADVMAIPDGLGGFLHNGGLHVVDARGTVLAVFPLEDFSSAYAFALARARGSRP